MILKLILDGKYKSAFLALAFAFTYKDYLKNNLSFIFRFNKDYILAFEKFDKSFEFFSFTHITSTKIVNSIVILIYKYLKENTQIEEKNIKDLARNIAQIYFHKNSLTEYRDEFFKRDVYCAAIYNDIPIFQAYKPKDKKAKYYTDDNIEIIEKFFQDITKDLKLLKYVISGFFGKGLKTNEIEDILNPNKKLIRKMITDFPKTYIDIQSSKLYLKLQNKKSKKTMRYYLFYPLSYLYSLFVALYTKFAIK